MLRLDEIQRTVADVPVINQLDVRFYATGSARGGISVHLLCSQQSLLKSPATEANNVASYP
jgi:hypothetical protein